MANFESARALYTSTAALVLQSICFGGSKSAWYRPTMQRPPTRRRSLQVLRRMANAMAFASPTSTVLRRRYDRNARLHHSCMRAPRECATAHLFPSARRRQQPTIERNGVGYSYVTCRCSAGRDNLRLYRWRYQRAIAAEDLRRGR